VHLTQNVPPDAGSNGKVTVTGTCSRKSLTVPVALASFTLRNDAVWMMIPEINDLLSV
jgi:hypothetical protein